MIWITAGWRMSESMLCRIDPYRNMKKSDIKKLVLDWHLYVIFGKNPKPLSLTRRVILLNGEG